MRQAGVGRGVSVYQAAGLVAFGLLLATGCSQNKKSADCAPTPEGCDKPIVVYAPPVTEAMLDTPSSLYVKTANVQTAVVQRDWPTMASYYDLQVVRHGPLYFEDPFEDKEKVSGCGYMGITWEDFLVVPYSDARWLLNQAALPVSMVVTPPWTPMCSDGQLSRQALGYDHDAAPCTQPVPAPFDLKCPEQQAAWFAAAGQTNLPAVSEQAAASQPAP